MPNDDDYANGLAYEIRPVERLEELHACEAVAKLVWQVDDRELIPASHLRALAHGGGLVAGAFEAGALVGFSVGFLARHTTDEAIGFHSHLMGVLPEHRRAGVALRLKWFQRRWCLEQRLRWITWTFDPLQAGSARLNLERLGAVGERYARDYYGALGGVRFGSLPTDRLWVRWRLDAERVARLADRDAADGASAATSVPGGATPAPGTREARPDGAADETMPTDPERPADPPWALAPGPDEGPGELALERTESAVRVAIPASFEPLLYRDPRGALAWRHAVRAAMEAYMERGYRATRFVGNAFELHLDEGRGRPHGDG